MRQQKVSSDDYSGPMPCPLPYCNAVLNLERKAVIGIDRRDLLSTSFNWVHAYVTTWEVICDAGHVVLAPEGAEDFAPLPTQEQLRAMYERHQKAAKEMGMT